MTVVELMCLLEQTGDLDAEVLIGSWDGTIDTTEPPLREDQDGKHYVLLGATGFALNRA